MYFLLPFCEERKREMFSRGWGESNGYAGAITGCHIESAHAFYGPLSGSFGQRAVNQPTNSYQLILIVIMPPARSGRFPFTDEMGRDPLNDLTSANVVSLETKNKIEMGK